MPARELSYSAVCDKIKRVVSKGRSEMKNTIKKLISCDQKKIAWILLTVFVLSLIPLLYLSGYVHASGDDYGYGANTHRIWLETRSLFGTLKAAADTSVEYWHSWQGTWFTIFLMALQPEVFSPGGYWIVPWIMLGINILSTSLLTHYFFVKRLKLSKALWGCVNSLLLMSMIQFFPFTKSGIFWWNGTVHYIVPYSLAMVTVYGMFRFGDTEKKRFLVLTCLCMFCLGGSSYLAPLFVLVVLFYLLIFEGRKKKHLFWLLLPAAIEMAGLIVSFLAPGNKRRGGEDFGFHWLLIVETIVDCFKEGVLTACGYVRDYPAIFLCFLFLAMLLVEAFMQQEKTARFPMPLLFVVLMFCLYCAVFAPGIYSGVDVSGGVPNTIFQVFLLTFLAALVYVLGWLCAKWKEKRETLTVLQIRLMFMPFLCIGLVLLFLQKGTLKDATAYECYAYVASGRADDYKAQMEERLAILLDPTLKEVELPEMNPDQGPLMHMEVMENPEAWTNMVAEQFFQKDRIVQVKRKE